MSVVTLAGCGKTGFLAAGEGDGLGGAGGGGSAAADGGATGGEAAAGGAGAGGAAVTGGGGGAGEGEGGAPVPADDCLATCCDGATVHGTSPDAQACAMDNGLACESKGGPQSIAYGGAVMWKAEGPCPTMAPCTVNCCSGVKGSPGDQFDPSLCATAGVQGGVCAGQGGAAKVLYDGQLVFQDLACPGNCQASCCDGSVAFADQPGQIDCKLFAARACGVPEGGPTVVAYSGTLLWTAGGHCPSLLPCLLVCKDGVQDVSQQYDAAVCLTVSMGGVFCANHGGPAVVAFDGQSLWKSPP